MTFRRAAATDMFIDTAEILFIYRFFAGHMMRRLFSAEAG